MKKFYKITGHLYVEIDLKEYTDSIERFIRNTKDLKKDKIEQAINDFAVYIISENIMECVKIECKIDKKGINDLKEDLKEIIEKKIKGGE